MSFFFDLFRFTRKQKSIFIHCSTTHSTIKYTSSIIFIFDVSRRFAYFLLDAGFIFFCSVSSPGGPQLGRRRGGRVRSVLPVGKPFGGPSDGSSPRRQRLPRAPGTRRSRRQRGNLFDLSPCLRFTGTPSFGALWHPPVKNHSLTVD